MAAKHYTAACLLACFLACASADLLLNRPQGDCLSPAVASTTYNFYPKSYQLTSIQAPSSSGLSTTVEFAQDFSVSYRGTYKVVRNKRANETYVLYQCGTPNPLNSADTELAVPANTKVFEIPLVSVAVEDSGAAGFLVELGLIDRVAFSSKYSYNQCLQAISACGDTAVSPSEPTDYDESPSNDAEFATTVAAWKAASAAQNGKVDAIFTSTATANPKSIAVTAFADPGVLNRAEWVKFVAVFFNKEVEAERLFANISSSYEQQNSTARKAAADQGKTVAWISKSGDTMAFDYTAYKTQYMTDAGGRLLPAADLAAAGGKEVKGQYSTLQYTFNASVPAQKAAFLAQLKKVDIIFDDSYAANSSNLLDLAASKALYKLDDAAAASIPAVAAGQVWTFNNRLGQANPQSDGLPSNDWFESSVARPDLVLADFVKVITPSAAPANGPVNWLRQLGASQALKLTTPANCSSIKASGADKCTRPEPARICPNAYRDCATGQLQTVTDPNQRCQAQTVCPDAVPSGSSNSSATSTTQNAAASTTAGTAQLLLTLLGAALLVLML